MYSCILATRILTFNSPGKNCKVLLLYIRSVHYKLAHASYREETSKDFPPCDLGIGNSRGGAHMIGLFFFFFVQYSYLNLYPVGNINVLLKCIYFPICLLSAMHAVTVRNHLACCALYYILKLVWCLKLPYNWELVVSV